MKRHLEQIDEANNTAEKNFEKKCHVRVKLDQWSRKSLQLNC